MRYKNAISSKTRCFLRNTKIQPTRLTNQFHFSENAPFKNEILSIRRSASLKGSLPLNNEQRKHTSLELEILAVAE